MCDLHPTTPNRKAAQVWDQKGPFHLLIRSSMRGIEMDSPFLPWGLGLWGWWWWWLAWVPPCSPDDFPSESRGRSGGQVQRHQHRGEPCAQVIAQHSHSSQTLSRMVGSVPEASAELQWHARRPMPTEWAELSSAALSPTTSGPPWAKLFVDCYKECFFYSSTLFCVFPSLPLSLHAPSTSCSLSPTSFLSLSFFFYEKKLGGGGNNDWKTSFGHHAVRRAGGRRPRGSHSLQQHLCHSFCTDQEEKTRPARGKEERPDSLSAH